MNKDLEKLLPPYIGISLGGMGQIIKDEEWRIVRFHIDYLTHPLISAPPTILFLSYSSCGRWAETLKNINPIFKKQIHEDLLKVKINKYNIFVIPSDVYGNFRKSEYIKVFELSIMHQAGLMNKIIPSVLYLFQRNHEPYILRDNTILIKNISDAQFF